MSSLLGNVEMARRKLSGDSNRLFKGMRLRRRCSRRNTAWRYSRMTAEEGETLEASMATQVPRVGTVNRNSLGMTISSSGGTNISERAIAIIGAAG